MTNRRIGPLDTLAKCRRECLRLYQAASKGEIAWPEVDSATAVLERLSKMIAADVSPGHEEADWNNVGANAVRGQKDQ